MTYDPTYGLAPTIEIVSRQPGNSNRPMRKYRFDPGTGQPIDHIGVHGNEPFNIRIHAGNKRTAVRVSVDGTDIATGAKAFGGYGGPGTFIIEANDSSTFKAWVESNKAGAEFVFSSAENSVAANTHGDLTAKGFISVLYYTEGYQPPVYRGYEPYSSNGYASKGLLGGDYLERGGATRSMSLGPAVGAGRQVDQHIGTTSGLREPKLGGVVQVRYMWWNELCDLMARCGVNPNGSAYPSGFFEPTRSMANLGNTPRIGELPMATIAAPVSPPPVTERYLRF